MNTIVRIGLCGLISGCLIGIAGCKKQPAPPPSPSKPAAAGVNETAPVAEVKAAAEKMNVEQLKATATKYKDAIVAKKAELEKATAKLKAIPLTEQVGAEAKAIQANIGDINKSITALTERFQVYYDKLKAMGGDVSGLTI